MRIFLSSSGDGFIRWPSASLDTLLPFSNERQNPRRSIAEGTLHAHGHARLTYDLVGRYLISRLT